MATTIKKDEEPSRMVRFLKDYAAGQVGGWAQVLSGQPFDTVKVRMQTQTPTNPIYKGPLDCAKQIMKKEGVSGFFKGTLAPMLGVGLAVSIQFAVVGQVKSFFNGNDPNKKLTYTQLFICGAAGGFGNTFVSTPVELIRIKLQLQEKKTDGPYKLVKNMVKKHGITSPWKGIVITTLREMPGFGFYFLVYEWCLRKVMKSSQNPNDVPPIWILLSGAAGGYGMWISCFPLDVLKSRIQSDSFDPAKRKYNGIIDCAKIIYRTEGFMGFWKGFVPCMIRAFPVNAATFFFYEQTMRILGGRDY